MNLMINFNKKYKWIVFQNSYVTISHRGIFGSFPGKRTKIQFLPKIHKKIQALQCKCEDEGQRFVFQPEQGLEKNKQGHPDWADSGADGKDTA